MVDPSKKQSLIRLVQDNGLIPRKYPGHPYPRETYMTKGGVGCIYHTTPTTVNKVIDIDRLGPLAYYFNPDRYLGSQTIPFSVVGDKNEFGLMVDGNKITLDRFKQDALSRAVCEGQVMTDVGDIPSVVQSTGFDLCLSPSGLLFCDIGMEYIPGIDTFQLIRKKELNIYESAKCIADIAFALIEIHKRGFVHRDVKPGNIIYDQKSAKATLVDFGIAKNLRRYGSQRLPLSLDYRLLLAKTDDNENEFTIGTPRYMSPEQARAELSQQSDHFGLGVSAFELFARRRLFPDLEEEKFCVVEMMGYKNTKRDQLIDSLISSSYAYFGITLPNDLVDAINLLLDEEPTKRELKPIAETAYKFAQKGESFQKTRMLKKFQETQIVRPRKVPVERTRIDIPDQATTLETRVIPVQTSLIEMIESA